MQRWHTLLGPTRDQEKYESQEENERFTASIVGRLSLLNLVFIDWWMVSSRVSRQLSLFKVESLTEMRAFSIHKCNLLLQFYACI
jgi:fumarate reductase subunit D